MTKRCPKCGVVKPVGEWGRNSSKKDGLQGWCKSCLRDYSNVRYANDQKFAERKRERHREWYSDPDNADQNRERCRNYSNARYANDREFAERQRQYKKERYANDPEFAEQKQQSGLKWAKNNPEACRERSRRRHAVKNGVDAEKIDLAALYDRDDWVCHLCDESVDRDLKYPDPGSASHDHVVPISRGGTHTWDNVKLSHLRCNLSKSNKTMEELDD